MGKLLIMKKNPIMNEEFKLLLLFLKTINEEFKLSPMQFFFFFVHFNKTLDNNNMVITSTIFELK